MVKWKKLEPINCQKSFYGKALYATKDKETWLASYNTLVCYLTINGQFVKLWDDYSRTTMKHINSFRQKFGYPVISKKEWEEMPVYRGKRSLYEY